MTEEEKCRVKDEVGRMVNEALEDLQNMWAK
jgi:hypothetical protein